MEETKRKCIFGVSMTDVLLQAERNSRKHYEQIMLYEMVKLQNI